MFCLSDRCGLKLRFVHYLCVMCLISVGQCGALDGDGAGGCEVRGDVGELGGMIAQGGRGWVAVEVRSVVEVEVDAADLRC